MEYRFFSTSKHGASYHWSPLQLPPTKSLERLRNMLLGLAIVLVCSSASLSATFVVTKTADTNDGVCDTDCSLREAIALSNANSDADVILFDSNTFSKPQLILLSGMEISIAANSHLTIKGPGPNLLSIDGDLRSRILFVGEGATANVSGLNLVHGNGVGTDSRSGGAIRVSNFSNVTLSNIVVKESRTANQGGAIFIANSTMTLTDSIISNNRADSSAGGVGIYASNVSMINTAVVGNIIGGGIQISGNASSGVLNVYFCNISDNITGGDGGGIDNGGATVIISDSTLNGNIGRQGGGAVSGTNGSIWIVNSTFINNRAEFFGGGAIKSYGMLKISGSKILNNVAVNSEGGGGIYHRGSGTTVEITESRIEGNSTTGSGGGILNDGEGLNDNYAMEVRESFIAGNTANQKGGGFTNLTNFYFRNVTVYNNTSLNSGGGIANEGLGYILNATITENHAASGGGVANPQLLHSRNSIIANNYASSDIARDWSGFFDSLGFNLLRETEGVSIEGNTTGNIYGSDPQLGPLADNGGRTPSIALLIGSPAIDAADPAIFPTLDQRGFARPKDGDGNGSWLPDMGAFELDLFGPATAPFDFDGDGKTDVGIYRPVGGEWWWRRSSDGVVPAVQFGTESDVIAPGDFTGDGKLDHAFFRPSDGYWHILRSDDFTYFAFPFGQEGDVPVTGDFDGDGKADAAVYRTGTWFILRSSDGGTTITGFGVAGDIPVTADYDGDGKDDIGIYRPSGGEWWINRSTAGLLAMQFGSTNDKTVPGDYTGDGRADVAFWRPSTGEWFVVRSEDSSYYAFPFGQNGDIPAPGDYDGDGKIDAAVFRNGVWYIAGTTSGTQVIGFGVTGDRPIPNSFVR